MNHIKIIISSIWLILFFSSCENSIEPHISKCDSLKTNLTGNWIAFYVPDNNTENKVDSSKCIDGIPYDFYGGIKVEKNQNEPPKPVEILDFTSREFWEFNANDTLYIERWIWEPAYWLCLNDEIVGLGSDYVEVHHFSLGWDCYENTIQLHHPDLKDNTQNFQIVNFTDSTLWLKIPNDDSTLKLYKKEN